MGEAQHHRRDAKANALSLAIGAIFGRSRQRKVYKLASRASEFPGGIPAGATPGSDVQASPACGRRCEVKVQHQASVVLVLGLRRRWFAPGWRSCGLAALYSSQMRTCAVQPGASFLGRFGAESVMMDPLLAQQDKSEWPVLNVDCCRAVPHSSCPQPGSQWKARQRGCSTGDLPSISVDLRALHWCPA